MDAIFWRWSTASVVELWVFLDGVSEEFANTQNVDWNHPEKDDN